MSLQYRYGLDIPRSNGSLLRRGLIQRSETTLNGRLGSREYNAVGTLRPSAILFITQIRRSCSGVAVRLASMSDYIAA